MPRDDIRCRLGQNSCFPNFDDDVEQTGNSEVKNFLVITISDILKIQLEDIIRRHRLPLDVDVHTGDDFDKILD